MEIVKIFRDTANPGGLAIDNTYQGVLAYADGRYAWPLPEIHRFASAGKIINRVCTNARNPRLGRILDVERWDATPEEAGVWVPERNRLRNDATVYCNTSTVPAVADALGRNPCWLIVADWTGEPHIPQMSLPANIRLAGVQYATVIDRYDVTAVYSRDWLGR